MSKETVVDTKRREKIKDNILGYSFLAPALILLGIFLVIPVGMVIYYAFTDYYLLTPDERKFVGLENFIRLTKDPIFLKSFLNTLKFVVWIIPVQLGAALGMAVLTISTIPLILVYVVAQKYIVQGLGGSGTGIK